MFNTFIQELKHKLSQPLPGQAAQFEMASEGRKGYPYDISKIKGYRESAVCLFLFERKGKIVFPLIERVKYPGVHSGQLALPGGKIEEGDEDHVHTALREMHEEIGVRADREQVIGALSDIYIPPSNFMVKPVIAFSHHEPEFIHNPTEVEQLIEFGVEELLDDGIVKQTELSIAEGMKIKTPYFEVRGKILWGATAMMLNEFKTVLRS